MRASLLLLVLLGATGCQGQLVMYFVNALGDMLQRRGIQELFTPPDQSVDENVVDEPGTGLTGNMIMKLKQQLGTFNVSNLFAIPTPQPLNIKVTKHTENAQKLHVMKNASQERSKEIVGNVRRRYRLLSRNREISEFGMTPETPVRSGELIRPSLTERRRLRPEGSRLSALRPRTRPPPPVRPGTPLIRPSPRPRPTGRVVIPGVVPTGSVRTVEGRGDSRSLPIVIVPQAPGQVQPFGGPRARLPVRQGPLPGSPLDPLVNPLPPLVPPGGPRPDGIPDLSVPFDSRPRPDGTVPEDPRDVLTNPRNDTNIDEAPDSQIKQEQLRLPVPVKPNERRLPPNARPGPVVPTLLVPGGQPNVRFLTPRPVIPPQRTVQSGPQNRGVKPQIGPNLQVFNAPIRPGQPRVVMGPNGPIQLPPGFMLTGPNGQQGQRPVPNQQGARPRNFPTQRGPSRRPVNPRIGQPGPNLPIFTPIANGTGTRRGQQQGARSKQPQSRANLQSVPLDGRVQNTVPQPSLSQPKPFFAPGQVAPGQRPIFRRPVQPPPPNQQGGQRPNGETRIPFPNQPVQGAPRPVQPGQLPPGFKRRFLTRGRQGPQGFQPNVPQQRPQGLQGQRIQPGPPQGNIPPNAQQRGPPPQVPPQQGQRSRVPQQVPPNRSPNVPQAGPNGQLPLRQNPQQVRRPQQQGGPRPQPQSGRIGPVPGQPPRRPTVFIPPGGQQGTQPGVHPNQRPPQHGPPSHGPPGTNPRPVVPQPNKSARDSLQNVPRVSA